MSPHGYRRPALDPALAALLSVLALIRLADVLWFIPDPGIDFGTFYASAAEWLIGRQPYPMVGIEPPNLTPPVMLLVFAPFTRLPLGAARAVWSVLSLACVAASVWVAGRDAPMRSRDLLIIVLAASPTALAFGLGQVSCLLMLLMTLAWTAMRRSRPVASGAWLGVICLLKPFYGLFLLWLLWKREWRAASALLGVVGAGMLASMLLVGRDTVLMWTALIRRITWQAHIYNASIDGVGARLFSNAPELPAATWTPLLVSNGARVIVDLALMVIVAVVAVRAVRESSARVFEQPPRRADHTVANVASRESLSSPAASFAVEPGAGAGARAAHVDTAFAALSAAGILLSPLAWVHYVPVSALPIVAVFARRPLWWRLTALALALFPYPMFINRHYSALGTLAVGQWSFSLVVFVLMAAAVGRDRQ